MRFSFDRRITIQNSKFNQRKRKGKVFDNQKTNSFFIFRWQDVIFGTTTFERQFLRLKSSEYSENEKNLILSHVDQIVYVLRI